MNGSIEVVLFIWVEFHEVTATDAGNFHFLLMRVLIMVSHVLLIIKGNIEFLSIIILFLRTILNSKKNKFIIA